MAQLYNIQSIPEALLPTMGGKARGLNKLITSGFNVPLAFVVTQIAEDDTLDDAVTRYHEMNFDLVSVRSSATMEDGDDYSAAGQFDTYLNVQGDDALKTAIRNCVNSLHNATAEHYQKDFLSAAKVDCQMNVIVQQMVNARCAGVIFTQAPMRAGYTLVEVVPGLGENLVSGKMAAQQYRVRKDFVEQMPDNPVLTKEQAIALAAEAKRIEQVFGQPMDLEWAMDEHSTIFWLQARPITVTESVTMNELDCKYAACQSVITTSNIGEVMPGAVTPLNLSTSMLALDWGVMKTYVQLGCIPEECPPFKYISPYYNHMFFNMTNMYEIGHCVSGTSKATLDESICGHELVGFPDNPMPDQPAAQKMRNTRVFMKYMLGGEAAKRGMDESVNQIHFDLSQDMHAIYQQCLENFQALKWVNYYHYRTSYYSGGMTNFLMMAIAKQFATREDAQSAVSGCLTGIDNFESADVLKQMRQLATLMVADDPATPTYSNAELNDYFLHKAGAQVRAAYDTFMQQHGHRGIREMEIRSASWRMNPESFCQSMHSVLASVQHAANTPSNAAAVQPWTDYVANLKRGQGWLKCKLIDKFVANARKGVQYREYTKARVILALDRYKQAYARIAEQMVEAGLLPDKDCIYFLQQDEVGRLLQGEKALVKKALARRRLFPQQMALKFPDTSLGIPQPLAAQQSDPSATRYEGTPVSRGTATGKARIVRSEQDATLLQPGEIMVAACTDIGWTPYYDSIGGLVTEIGSALSHGIVVAREYALPAVVNVANALQNIHTGDIISVDGNNGTVVIIQRCA